MLIENTSPSAALVNVARSASPVNLIVDFILREGGLVFIHGFFNVVHCLSWPKFWSWVYQNFGHEFTKILAIVYQKFGHEFTKILVIEFTKILVIDLQSPEHWLFNMNNSTFGTGSDSEASAASVNIPFLDMDLDDGVYMGIGFVLGILITLAFVCACKKIKKKPKNDFL